MRSDRWARAIARAWRTTLLVGVLGALVGLAATTVAPRSYIGTADVLLTPAPGTRTADAVDDRLLHSYAELVGSRRIAVAVREDTGSAQSVRSVEDDLSGEVVQDSTIVRVSARQRDAEAATALSRSGADALLQLLVDGGVALERPVGDDESPTASVVASVVDQSSVAARALTPSAPWWVVIGAGAGLLLGLLLAAARQLTDRLVRTPEDLAAAARAPMLAAIGYDRHTDRRPLLTDLGAGDPRTEATRILRTNLRFLRAGSSESVLTVTSCLQGEGKSTLAANLAISLAQGGQSVALVDADLRRPRLDALFGLDRTPGLTGTLVRSVDAADAMQQTHVPGLDVLPTGTLPPNPSELLQTTAMADLVLTLRRSYDVVLLDAPPVLPVTDAALLATLSDGAVLLVRHGRTTREQVRAATDRLAAVGADLLGTVLTMVPARGISRYGYGYGYEQAPKRSVRADEGRRIRR